MAKFTFSPGQTYFTLSGHKVQVEKQVGDILYGSAFNGTVRFEWYLDGTRRPRGGTDPFDLVEG